MITILIPTYNRPQFIERTLAYYASLNYDGFLSIGDSSVEAMAHVNLANVLKYSNKLKIIYRYFPKPSKMENMLERWTSRDGEGNTGYRDAGIVLAELGNTAPTSYAVFSGDDDFLVPKSLKECVRFLENNPSYSAAHGLRLHFTLDSGSEFKRIVLTRYIPEHLLESDSPGERWMGYMRYAYSTQFYVHRRETWQRMYADMSHVTEHYLGAEVLPCSMTCILGKVAQLDCLATLFQENYGYEKTFSWESHSVYGLMQAPNWHNSVQGLRHAIESSFVRQNGMPPREARELFDREFRLHLITFLEWQFDKKYGKREHLPLGLNPAPFSSVYELVMSPEWHSWVTRIRSDVTKHLARQLGTEAAVQELFDKWLWINLAVRLKEEYLNRYGNDASWWHQHHRLMAAMNERFANSLQLQSLLNPASPYHNDFMPVYRIVQESSPAIPLGANTFTGVNG